MAKSLIQRLRENVLSVDAEASRKMADELEYIRKQRSLLDLLMSFDGGEIEVDVEAALTEDLEMLSVSSPIVPIRNRFSLETCATPYDDFDTILLAHDWANYLSALRAKWAEPVAFGPTEEWVVWFREGHRVRRARLRGRLSALLATFPDAVGRRILDMAGLDVSALRTPILVIRAGVWHEWTEAKQRAESSGGSGTAD